MSRQLSRVYLPTVIADGQEFPVPVNKLRTQGLQRRHGLPPALGHRPSVGTRRERAAALAAHAGQSVNVADCRRLIATGFIGSEASASTSPRTSSAVRSCPRCLNGSRSLGSRTSRSRPWADGRRELVPKSHRSKRAEPSAARQDGFPEVTAPPGRGSSRCPRFVGTNPRLATPSYWGFFWAAFRDPAGTNGMPGSFASTRQRGDRGARCRARTPHSPTKARGPSEHRGMAKHGKD